MPKVLNLENELQKTRNRIKDDPNAGESIVCKVRLPVYEKIILSALEANEPLATHAATLMRKYWDIMESGGLDADNGQLATLAALCRLWGCSPVAAVRKVFERAGDRVLAEETVDIQRKLALIPALSGRK
jgi:hypothetical protein